MTNQQHPIPPPPKLVQQWIRERDGLEHLATQAAQWGADQELEACCKWLNGQRWEALAIHLREYRRPKPPSLNEVALQMLSTIERDAHYLPEITDTIRRALEQLDD